MSYLDLPIVGKGSLYSDLWMIMTNFKKGKVHIITDESLLLCTL